MRLLLMPATRQNNIKSWLQVNRLLTVARTLLSGRVGRVGPPCSGCLKQEFELRERLANGRPSVFMRFVSPFAAAGMSARLRGAEGCHGKFPELRSGIRDFSHLLSNLASV